MLRVSIPVFCAVFAFACGDDSSSPDASTDAAGDTLADVSFDRGSDVPDPDAGSPSTGSITFPPGRAAVEAAEVFVAGVADDADGISVVRVGGVDAVSDDAFATWSARVSLDPGDNEIVVEVEDAVGVTEEIGRVVVTRRSWFDNLQGIEAIGDRVFLLDIDRNAVFEYDLASHAHRVLSAPGIPDDANDPIQARSIALDEGRNRLLLVDRDAPALFAVDLDTGARTVVSDDSSPGPAFTGPTVCDLAGALLYVIDAGRLLEVDTETGARRLVSGPGMPDDVNTFETPWSVAVDSERGRVLVAQRDPDDVLAVDLDTGARTVLSANDAPAGEPLLNAPAALQVGADGLYLTATTTLVRVDLFTGARSEVSAPLDPFRFTQALDMTLRGGEALLVDRVRGRIVSVGLEDGSQSIVGGSPFPSTVEPTTLDAPEGIAVAPGRVYWTESVELHVLTPDGDRRVHTRFRDDPEPPTGLVSPVWDAVAEQLIVADLLTGRIFSVAADGTHALILDHEASVGAIALDVAGRRMFFLDGDEVFWEAAIDGTSTRRMGDRDSPGVGWAHPNDFVYDTARDQLIAVSHVNDSVVGIAIEDATRTLIEETDEDGELVSPFAIDLDGDVAYILSLRPSTIHRLDLTTGERTKLASPEGNAWSTSQEYMRLDGERLWTAAPLGVIHAVSIETGEHVAMARR